MSRAGFIASYILIELFMIVVPILFFMRRDREVIAKRDWKPLIILVFVNIYTCSRQIRSLAPLFGIPPFESKVVPSVYSVPMATFPFVGIYMMRAYRLFKDYYYNQTRVGGYKGFDKLETLLLGNGLQRKPSQASIGTSTSGSMIFNVSKTSNSWLRGVGIPLGIVLFGFLFGLIYSQFPYQTLLPVTFTMVTLFAINTMTFFIMLRRVHDPYYVKYEMLFSSVVFIILTLASGGQYAALGRIENPTAAQLALPSIHPFIIVISSNLLSFLLPLVASYQKSSIEEKSTDIKAILRNKTEWKEFQKVCADYFCLENALFIQALEKVKTNATAKGIEMICSEFIVPGAPNELNLSSSLRKKIIQQIKIDAALAIGLLDMAEKEVLKLLQQNIVPHYIE